MTVGKVAPPRDFAGSAQLMRGRTAPRSVPPAEGGADLIANGVGRRRIELAPDPLIFPALPAADSLVSAARSALDLPADAFVVGVPPVPDWIDGPDLTLALAWELQRRRGSATPYLVWYGMPDDNARRSPIEYDIERRGLDNVRVTRDLPGPIGRSRPTTWTSA